MKTLSGFFLVKVLGWKINGDFPALNKSVVIFAPHTSYYDGLYGKLYLNEIGIDYKILSKKELFFFPMTLVMKLIHSIPVGQQYKNTINHVVGLFNSTEKLHILLSPEGTRKKVEKWNKGFYYMAMKAKVPITVGCIDYKKKEIGVAGVIDSSQSIDAVMKQLNLIYKDVTAKHPERFALELK